MATAKIEEREGIVLSRIPQKERDAMVRCLGKDGFFTFYSRGALKVGTSSGVCTQELALSAFNLVVSGSGSLTLREGSLKRLYAPKGGLEGMLVANLLLEYCLRALHEDDAKRFYPVLETALEALELGRDPFSVATIYLAKAALIGGYGLEVDHCVYCGKASGIAAMDIGAGGYLCLDCLRATSGSPSSLDEMKVFRHAFRCPVSDLTRVDFPIEGAKSALRKLLRHTEAQTGVYLRSLNMVLRP